MAEMEVDDDVFVVIIGDEEDGKIDASQFQNVKIKEEVLDETADYLDDSTSVLNMENILDMVEKHGEVVEVDIEKIIKEEPEYIEEETLDEYYDENYASHSDDCTVEIHRQEQKEKHRYKMLKAWERKSFIEELRQEHPVFKNNSELLTDTLTKIMRSVKPPELPQDYYVMNGTQLECVNCGVMSDSIPAAGRHYQEKHGPRYLICYACGVDFRSTTNLYKHEKRCNAPDAVIMLKARARFLGRKGRARPYLCSNPYRISKFKKKPIYNCKLCSAKFNSRTSLEAHEYHHQGLRPFRCSHCPAAYTSHSALARHSGKHTDVQYICDHCQRSFKSKTILIAHMDTHRPVKKFGCDECERRFAQKMALQRHVERVHRNLPPPFACQICPKRYPRMSLLKDHMSKSHGMVLMTRKMFFKMLPTMSQLEIDKAKLVLKSDLNSENDSYETFKDNYTEIANEVTVIDNNNRDNTEDLSEDLMKYIYRLQKHEGDGVKVICIKNGKIVDINECEISDEDQENVDGNIENNVNEVTSADKDEKNKAKECDKLICKTDEDEKSNTEENLRDLKENEGHVIVNENTEVLTDLLSSKEIYDINITRLKKKLDEVSDSSVNEEIPELQVALESIERLDTIKQTDDEPDIATEIQLKISDSELSNRLKNSRTEKTELHKGRLREKNSQ